MFPWLPDAIGGGTDGDELWTGVEATADEPGGLVELAVRVSEVPFSRTSMSL
jgi:hypothetical protein